ncbi:MAG: VWA domain-containing protein, partial [Muribaculaceae bacterium]|nr:VWA domain-containing protein [Muribaculaceae bacterium]
MQFAHPHILYLLLLLIPLTAWYIIKQRNAQPSLGVSSLKRFGNINSSWRSKIRHLNFALRLIAISALVIALARPQTHDAWNESKIEGTDIVLALDISSSMLARDFDPNRLESAKTVASQFIAGRENDNIGIVIFAGESLTGLPMTPDRATLTNYVQSINQEMLDDGTAIGDGLATSINRIKNGKAVSKSIILLTDGSNNTGVIAPITAAEVAAELGIKVYTIGVGTNGMAPYPVVDVFGRVTYEMMPVQIDEATLKRIASITGGQY